MDIRHELVERLVLVASSEQEISSIRACYLELLGEYDIFKLEEDSFANLDTHIQHFLDTKKIEGLSSATLSNYKLYLTHFSSYVSKDVSDITTDDIRSFLGTKNVKKSSIQTITNILRSFFSWLMVEEVLSKNPMLKVKTIRKHRSVTHKALSVEELERLRNACTTAREKALIEFFYATGCRLAEVVSIRLPDVDFIRRTVRVTGKGDKDRIVYFSVKAKLLLETYLKQRECGGSALFSNLRTASPMHSRSVQIVIQRLGVKAGLSERLHPHLLRHTFATLSLNNGMDITIIQKLLGHSQLSTTELYACVSQETIRQSYDRVIS